jgi:ubiquinone/menaquinone biosynthesis C-methylase UbiE
MSLSRTILLHAFGRPRGVLGRLGGRLMARMNAGCGAWVAELLEIEASDNVLEIGFGPGVTIARLARLVPAGRIAGIDPSQEMLEQARRRNASAIRSAHVDLKRGVAEELPFDANSFDRALAINSMQVWTDPVAGLREMRRVVKPSGRVALGFTAHSGQRKEGLSDMLLAAGWPHPQVAEKNTWFCALATKPSPEVRQGNPIRG